MPKAGGIESLSGLFDRIDHAYLIGEAAPDFAHTIGDALPVTISGTLDRAVADAFAEARQSRGERPVVLLSTDWRSGTRHAHGW